MGVRSRLTGLLSGQTKRALACVILIGLLVLLLWWLVVSSGVVFGTICVLLVLLWLCFIFNENNYLHHAQVTHIYLPHSLKVID